MTHDEIKKDLTSIIASVKDEKVIDQLSKVIGDLDLCKKDFDDLKSKHENLIENYGKAVSQLASKTPPQDGAGIEAPKTLEDVVADVLKNKK